MNKSSKSLGNLPEIQQWAILNQQRALEAQKMIQARRLAQYNKKMKFKNDLDMQVMSKSDIYGHEQQSDKQYLQYILKKAQEQKYKQDQEKQEKIQKRKQIQQENLKVLNQLKYSKVKPFQPEYTLDIGVQSQILQKQRQKKGIRQMMDTLDAQLREKYRQSIKSRESLSRQATSFVKGQLPNPARSPKYRQDYKVYQTYEQALIKKKHEEQQFYKKITDQASRKIAKQNQTRIQWQKARKNQLKAQMLQTLEKQVQSQSKKRQQQRQNNLQEPSFKFISQMFRQKPASYNKNLYYQQLRKQAEEQRQQRKHQKYMNQEQYKMNMNQLNKIVSGQYVHDKYLDRSMDNIGSTDIQEPVVKSYGKNSEYIKSQIEKLRGRQRSAYYSRLQY